MYTDDIINVPDIVTPESTGTPESTVTPESTGTSESTGGSSGHSAHAERTTTMDVVGPHARPQHEHDAAQRVDEGGAPSRHPSRAAVVAAIVATLLLLVTMATVLLRGGDDTEAVASDTTVAPAIVPTSATPGTMSPDVDVVSSIVPPVVPVVPVPPAITAPPVDTAPPVVPPPVEPPVAPPVDTIPPVVPPAPAGELAAQPAYLLDPGVDAVSIALSNQGDRELTYDITNDGDGFTADQPTATIAAGASVDVWIQLDVAADGAGPTPFERPVHVESDAGDAVVTISGQVEKPGFVIADFDSVPFVDFRATLRFTNVGGLPVQIVGLDAPGLTTAPVPGEIAAGQTYELEVAICKGGAPIPTIIAHPQPIPLPPKFTIAGWVELETQAGPDVEPTIARTDLQAMVTFFDPPDCSPVVAVPVGDLTFDLG